MLNARNDQAGHNTASDIAKSAQASFATALGFPQKIAEANLHMASVLLGFVSRRAKAQAEFFGELCQCKDFASAMEVQRAFWGRATEDYSKEAHELSDIARSNVTAMTQAAPEKEQGTKAAA